MFARFSTIIIIAGTIILLGSSSCNNIFNHDKYKKVTNLINISNKPLIINYPLPTYTVDNGWSEWDKTNKMKIVTYIDTRCSVCLEELGLWKEFINEYDSFDIDFFFFLNVNDMKRIDFFLNNINFKYPVIIDKNNAFIVNNKLLSNKIKTFLIDKNNTILLAGNPLYNKNLATLYRKEIEKRRKTQNN